MKGKPPAFIQSNYAPTSQRLIALARAGGARTGAEIDAWIKANRATWSKGVLK